MKGVGTPAHGAFNGPKAKIGQLRIVNKFSFSMHGCKSIAGNYSQTAGVSPPVMLCQVITAAISSFCLFLGFFDFHFLSPANEMHAQSDSGQVIDLAVAEHSP